MLEGVKELNGELNQIVGNIAVSSSLGQAVTSSELVDLEEYLRRRDELIAEFNTKIAEIQAQIDSLQVEIATVEGQISNWNSKINTIEPQLDTLEQEYYDLQNVYSAVSDVPGIPYRADSSWDPWPDELDDAQSRVFVLPIDIDEDGIQNLHDEAWFEYLYCRNWWQRGRPGITTNLYNRWNDALKAEVSKFKAIVDAKFSELSEAKSDIAFYKDQRLAAENTLESRTRHMRDLQLAKEAAEEEKRGALALWEVDWQAAKERKRIEIASIARDVALGYPTMDAETASNIAEMAYAEALAKGFTRLADAIRIAGDLADEWEDKPIIPHYTTKTIFCSSCGTKLEITTSDIERDNRELSCPKCGFSIGRGVQVRVIELPEPEPEPEPVGLKWYEKYWKYITVVGAGVGVTAIVLAKKKK